MQSKSVLSQVSLQWWVPNPRTIGKINDFFFFSVLQHWNVVFCLFWNVLLWSEHWVNRTHQWEQTWNLYLSVWVLVLLLTDTTYAHLKFSQVFSNFIYIACAEWNAGVRQTVRFTRNCWAAVWPALNTPIALSVSVVFCCPLFTENGN